MTESANLLLGRYRLVDRIGRGGMGSVWRAHDEYLQRPVAIKEIHLSDELDEIERAERRRRVIREARAAARLRHPSVVGVYDVVEQDNRPWIVMELVESRSLEEIVKATGPIPFSQAAHVGLQLVDALRTAHQAGVIHRDVKPSNVLIAPEGRVVLTDFGIATYDGASALTRSGTFLGSPAYLAPEIARGERATPASDLWSLGATLYAAVEGRPPYDRDTAVATLGALLTQEPDPPDHAGPLQPVIRALLRKQPAQRSSVQRTRTLLTRALEQDQGQPSWLGKRRDRTVIVGIATLIAGVVALSIVAFAHGDGSRSDSGAVGTNAKSPTTTQSSASAQWSPAARQALIVRCRVAKCGVFVSNSPDNDVLFNGNLRQGQVMGFDESRMNLVVADSSVCDVFINGRLQPKGPPGKRKIFTIVKA